MDELFNVHLLPADDLQLVWVGVCSWPVCVYVCVVAGAVPYSCLNLTHTYSARRETIYILEIGLEIMRGDVGGGSLTSDPCFSCAHMEEVFK